MRNNYVSFMISQAVNSNQSRQMVLVDNLIKNMMSNAELKQHLNLAINKFISAGVKINLSQYSFGVMQQQEGETIQDFVQTNVNYAEKLNRTEEKLEHYIACIGVDNSVVDLLVRKVEDGQISKHDLKNIASRIIGKMTDVAYLTQYLNCVNFSAEELEEFISSKQVNRQSYYAILKKLFKTKGQVDIKLWQEFFWIDKPDIQLALWQVDILNLAKIKDPAFFVSDYFASKSDPQFARVVARNINLCDNKTAYQKTINLILDYAIKSADPEMLDIITNSTNFSSSVVQKYLANSCGQKLAEISKKQVL